MAWQIEEVVQKGLCIGCGACASKSCAMTADSHGFLRPSSPPKLHGEKLRLFNEFCPGINLKLDSSTTNENYIPEWGKIEDCYVGWSSDKDVRHKGSSGGAISAILISLMRSKAIDFVAQIGVSKKSPFDNIRYQSRNADEILFCSGSRYAPSAHLQNLDEVFGTGEKFAFVGKPCDVAALKAILEQRPHLKKQVVVTISFMCAGVPSMNATNLVLSQLGARRENVIGFRYRGNGWPGFASAVLDTGVTLHMDYAKSWGEILGRDLHLRCKLCPDGIGEFADIVCADAWFGKDGYPDFTESDGRSLILTRTQNGHQVLKDVLSRNDLVVENFDLSSLKEIQPYQWTRKRSVLGRLLGYYVTHFAAPRFLGLRIIKCGIRGGFVNFLKSFYGSFKRFRSNT